MANGSDEIVEIGIRTTADASGAHVTADALDKTTAATAKLVSETERYAQALEKMEAAQAEGSGNTPGKMRAQEDAQWLGEMAERRRSVTEATKAGAVAEKEAAAAAGGALDDTIQKTSWLTVQKKDLRAAVRGLKDEFPLLAHVARLAINPIALAVAGIGAAWAIWNNRVKESTSLMAGAELPNVQPMDVAHVNAMAEAWASYNVELRKVRQTFDSVASAAERMEKATTATLDNQKKIAEATAGAENAKVAAGKASGDLTGPEAERAKLANEVAKIQEEARLEIAAAQEKVRVEEAKGLALADDAARKKSEAGKIRVATAEDDKSTEAELKAQAEVAKKDMQDRRSRVSDLAGYQAGEGGWFKRRAFEWQYNQRYGMQSPETARQLEEMGISEDQGIIGRYDSFRKRLPGRNIARGERAGLLQGAATEQGASEDILQNQLPADQALAEQKQKTTELVALLNILKEAYTTVGEGEKQAKEIAGQINRRIKEGVSANDSMLQALEAQRRFNDEITAWASNLEKQVGALRNK